MIHSSNFTHGIVIIIEAEKRVAVKLLEVNPFTKPIIQDPNIEEKLEDLQSVESKC